jgi:hypothetical protein
MGTADGFRRSFHEKAVKWIFEIYLTFPEVGGLVLIAVVVGKLFPRFRFENGSLNSSENRVLGNNFPGGWFEFRRMPGPEEILLPYALPVRERPFALIDPWWPLVEDRDAAILGTHF